MRTSKRCMTRSIDMKILFVCLGNICRSPIAHGIAQKLIDEKGLNWLVDSAGTSSYHRGEAPCVGSIKVAQQNGVDISKQRSRPLVMNDFEIYDLIVALDESNITNIKNMKATKKLHKLGSFGLDGKDIPDPYGFSDFRGFEKVYKMIELCVKNLVENLAEKGGLGQL